MFNAFHRLNDNSMRLRYAFKIKQLTSCFGTSAAFEILLAIVRRILYY